MDRNLNKWLMFVILIVVLELVGMAYAEQQADFPNSSDKIKIANFNIQVFGVSKASKENVMQYLAEIISNFDIVSIQEIRDISETAIEDLETVVDNLGVDYEYISGPRLGRTSSKEQYAYMYRTDTISYDSSYTYDDSEQDLFHREPFIARFQATAGNFDFVLLSIHVDPDEATDEISSLPLAVSDAQSHYSSEDDFIILGDLNADCSYFDEEDQNISLRDSQYIWLIDNSMDTNVASSQCTYDRIIMLNASKEDYSGTSNVFRFDDEFGLTHDEATEISDHYPVWSEFYINKDSDLPTLLTQTQISQLYVSIFGRASEGGGNAYWCSEQDNMTVAANAMLATGAAQSYFGDTLYDILEFIKFIYENTLGKTYEDNPTGVDYWVSELANGKSKGEVIATLINAAMDAAYTGTAAQNQFINKVTVCSYTANTITTAPDVNDLTALSMIILS